MEAEEASFRTDTLSMIDGSNDDSEPGTPLTKTNGSEPASEYVP